MDDDLRTGHYGSGMVSQWYMPDGWFPMDEEYELTEEDKESGLADFLYEARDMAAAAIENLFVELEINEKYCQHITNIPIGLEDGDIAAGKSFIGQYGIVLGRESSEVVGYMGESDEGRRRALSELAVTISHEMIHSIQTITPEDDDSYFTTIGNEMGWGDGLEEGMAEALGYISVKMKKTGKSLEEASRSLEEACEKSGKVPATQISARLIHKLDPEVLKWYLTCAQTGEYKDEDKIREIFGPRLFLNGMNYLYMYECGYTDDEKLKNLTIKSLTGMIDERTS